MVWAAARWGVGLGALGAAAALAVAGTAWAEEPPAPSEPVAAAPRAPSDGGPRRWRSADGGPLELLAAPASDAAAVQAAPGGAVLSNLGCAQGDGRVWCFVQPFRGGARGYVLAERLAPARGPDGIAPMGRDDSKRRARRGDFDARGEIPCAQIQGEPLGVCVVGVSRGGGGDATAVVTFSNGFARRLSFVHGEFTRADATMSGVGTDTDWRLEDGAHQIRVDDQRFILPNTLLLGD